MWETWEWESHKSLLKNVFVCGIKDFGIIWCFGAKIRCRKTARISQCKTLFFVFLSFVFQKWIFGLLHVLRFIVYGAYCAHHEMVIIALKTKMQMFFFSVWDFYKKCSACYLWGRSFGKVNFSTLPRNVYIG